MGLDTARMIVVALPISCTIVQFRLWTFWWSALLTVVNVRYNNNYVVHVIFFNLEWLRRGKKLSRTHHTNKKVNWKYLWLPILNLWRSAHYFNMRDKCDLRTYSWTSKYTNDERNLYICFSSLSVEFSWWAEPSWRFAPLSRIELFSAPLLVHGARNFMCRFAAQRVWLASPAQSRLPFLDWT